MWYLYPDLLINLKIRNTDNTYFVSSFNTNNERKYFPEELIRQLLYIKLVRHYGFPEEKLKIEYPIQMGITKKRADIVVFNDDLRPYIIAETKIKITNDSKEQLKSYINITRASYGILTSPSEIIFYKALDGVLHEIQDIPVCDSFENSSLVENKSQVDSSYFNMHGFESLVRINEKTSKITINTINYLVDNADLLKYDKIKKIALTKGVLLPLKIPSEHWHKIIEALFQNALDDNPAKLTKEENLAAMADNNPIVAWAMESLIIELGAKTAFGCVVKIVNSGSESFYENHETHLYPNYAQWCQRNCCVPVSTKVFRDRFLTSINSIQQIHKVTDKHHHLEGWSALGAKLKRENEDFQTWNLRNI